jgi:hypothetical protein
MAIRMLFGVTLVVIGLIWCFQGLGAIGGYGMSGQGEWTVIGGITALIGVATLVGARRARHLDRS